jgi:hypothetical protein
MRVADLQDFLRALIPPLQASGARKEIVDDLHSACHAFEPFADHPLKEFAGFLARAEEYHRTGVIPVKAKAASSPRAARPKEPALTLENAHSLIASLYDRSISDDVTYEYIADEVQKLEKLNAKDLKQVAEQFGVVPGKTKKGSLDAIRDKIAGRKTSHVRTLF